MFTVFPGLSPASTAARVWGVGGRLARDRGDDVARPHSGLVRRTTARDGVDEDAGRAVQGSCADAEVGAVGGGDPSVRDELARDVLDNVGRYCEADASSRPAHLGILSGQGRHADHLALEVDQRTARVARVDGRAGLDRGRQRDAAGLGELASERGHDPFGDRALEA